MNYYYEIADKIIMINSCAELRESGFCPLFRVEERKPDITVNISRCDRYSDGEVLYSTRLYNSLRSESGELFLQYINADTGLVCFELHGSGNEYNGFFTESDLKEQADMYYIWPLINPGTLMLEKSRLILHCSFIIRAGEAILFCGKSGAGKSTQAELWRIFGRAEVINGDKAVLYFNNGTLTAASLPFAGTSGICKNKKAPVKAIINLSQGSENIIRPLKGIEALGCIVSNTMFDARRQGMNEKAILNAAKIIKQTQIIGYTCTDSQEAVTDLLKYLEAQR